MPVFTSAVIIGSWLLLVGLTALAYRFNRDRGKD